MAKRRRKRKMMPEMTTEERGQALDAIRVMHTRDLLGMARVALVELIDRPCDCACTRCRASQSAVEGFVILMDELTRVTDSAGKPIEAED